MAICKPFFLLTLFCLAIPSISNGQYGGDLRIAGCHDMQGYQPKTFNICSVDVNQVQTILADSPAGSNEADVDIKWEGPGIVETGFWVIYGSLYPYVRFRTSTNGQIHVKWTQTSLDQNGQVVKGCREGFTLINIIKLPPPDVQVVTPIIKPGELATLIAKPMQCGDWTCETEWGISECDYISWSQKTPIYALKIYKSTTFTARTVDRGCYSEPVKYRVLVKRDETPASCPNDEQKETIRTVEEAVKQQDRKDYHYYSVESKVCLTSSPGCTAEAVFNKLTSDIQLNTPIAEDINKCLSILEKPVHYKTYYPFNTASPKPYPAGCQVFTIPKPSLLVFLASWQLQDCMKGYSDLVSDPVFVTVDNLNRCVTNYTVPGHTFYPGKVTRCVVDNGCDISIVTIGNGLTFAGDNACGKFIADNNLEKGSCIFQEIDKRLFKAMNER